MIRKQVDLEHKELLLGGLSHYFFFVFFTSSFCWGINDFSTIVGTWVKFFILGVRW